MSVKGFWQCFIHWHSCNLPPEQSKQLAPDYLITYQVLFFNLHSHYPWMIKSFCHTNHYFICILAHYTGVVFKKPPFGWTFILPLLGFGLQYVLFKALSKNFTIFWICLSCSCKVGEEFKKREEQWRWMICIIFFTKTQSEAIFLDWRRIQKYTSWNTLCVWKCLKTIKMQLLYFGAIYCPLSSYLWPSSVDKGSNNPLNSLSSEILLRASKGIKNANKLSLVCKWSLCFSGF